MEVTAEDGSTREYEVRVSRSDKLAAEFVSAWLDSKGALVLEVTGSPNTSYVLQSKVAVGGTSGAWQNVTTLAIGTSGSIFYTNAAPMGVLRVYRGLLE